MWQRENFFVLYTGFENDVKITPRKSDNNFGSSPSNHFELCNRVTTIETPTDRGHGNQNRSYLDMVRPASTIGEPLLDAVKAPRDEEREKSLSGRSWVHITDIRCFNPSPNDNILDWSKLKALADDKLNVTHKLKFVSERIENILGKGENAGYQHFLLFPKCFQKPPSLGSLKVGIVW